MAYTDIDDPSAYFQTALYTGTGSSLANTFDGNSAMQPDFVWIKERSGVAYHALYDSSRGVEKQIESNTTAVETTEATGLTAFGSDGFTVGALAQVNTSSDTYVAWGWKVNGGTTSSNTEGSITSTVQVNQDAGFSIVQYTGTGTAATIGHGLGVAPAMYIVKNRDQAGTSWTVFHKDLTSNAYSLYLSDTTAQSNAVGYWNGTSPTSTVFSIKNTSGDVNTNTEDYIAYCFAEVQGYSKFGSYVGNGNADGPFVYTGFKPAFLIMKEYSSAGGNWVMFDNKRDPSNVTKTRLFPNLANADNTTRDYIDLLSNGFKLRDTDADHNQSGESMVYMAFAENPFVTSTGVPATAR
jgi:hypothetical protein